MNGIIDSVYDPHTKTLEIFCNKALIAIIHDIEDSNIQRAIDMVVQLLDYTKSNTLLDMTYEKLKEYYKVIFNL